MTAVSLSLVPSRFVLALTFISVLTVSAAHSYVSPTGSRSATGSISSPWDLQPALNQPAAVKPGDPIWLRAGTYYGGFQSNLDGNAANPIIVRNYNGERVSIDGKGNENAWPSLAPGFVGDVPASPKITVYGPNIECINLVVHDTHKALAPARLTAKMSNCSQNGTQLKTNLCVTTNQPRP